MSHSQLLEILAQLSWSEDFYDDSIPSLCRLNKFNYISYLENIHLEQFSSFFSIYIFPSLVLYFPPQVFPKLVESLKENRNAGFPFFQM